MKTVFCLAVLALVAVNAKIVKVSLEKNIKGADIVITDTNMYSSMKSNLLSVVTNAYNKATDENDFTKRIADNIGYAYTSYYWSVLYDTLAYSTQQAYYAELTINGKDQVYVHGISKSC